MMNLEDVIHEYAGLLNRLGDLAGRWERQSRDYEVPLSTRHTLLECSEQLRSEAGWEEG